MSKTFTLKELELAFNSQDVDFETFSKDLIEKKAEEKKVKDKAKKEKQEEEMRTLSVDSVYTKEEVKGKGLDDFIKSTVKENEGYWDWFYDSDGIDDSGCIMEEPWLIDGELYLVTIECDAEWISDWSSRKNVPSNIRMTEFRKVTDFTLLEETEYGSASVKINEVNFKGLKYE